MSEEAPAALLRSTPTVPCSDGFAMPAYLARPAGDGPHPGVVFMYEAFGMNDEMRRIADELAAHGYAVLIPDLLARGNWFACIRALFADLRRGTGRGVDDLLAARAFLAEQPATASERMAIMGLCIGGGFALLLAKSGQFRVSAPFYGEVPADLTGACPVVASYGARDTMYTRQVPHLTTELDRLGVPHDVKVYDGAGHSFMNRLPNRAMGTLAHLVGAGFQPEAAADATERVVAFLGEHL